MCIKKMGEAEDETCDQLHGAESSLDVNKSSTSQQITSIL